MVVSITDSENVSTIVLEGSIDGKTAPEVRQQINPVLQKARSIIVDMSRVDYLSSAGLRLLLMLYRESAAKNGRIVLVGVSPDIQDVMSHTGFLSFFTLANSQAEAMQSFS
jgi:anti-sigma B factor antagonist